MMSRNFQGNARSLPIASPRSRSDCRSLLPTFIIGLTPWSQLRISRHVKGRAAPSSAAAPPVALTSVAHHSIQYKSLKATCVLYAGQ